jgi:DNA-binding LacI/PurR family transcriptional regulator
MSTGSGDRIEVRSGRPTIIDVAERAGVSKSLVSLVLRGQSGVSEARRKAVLDAADALGYRPNAAARSLVQKRTHTVGALLGDLRNPWFIDLLESTRDELGVLGLNLFLSEVHHGQDDSSVLDAFVDAQVDGVMFLGTMPITNRMLALAAELPSVVVSGREPDLPTVDVITGDDVAGAVAAVDHLIGLGHQRIAHLGGTGRAAELRIDGYRKAMHAAGLSRYIRVEISDRSEAGDQHAARQLLHGRGKPTAVLANNDFAALLLMSEAHADGLSIPDDLSVVGYDDSPIARVGYIGLTTIDNNYVDMGRLAAHQLERRIESPTAPRTVTLLDPSLRVRRTTSTPSVDS